MTEKKTIDWETFYQLAVGGDRGERKCDDCKYHFCDLTGEHQCAERLCPIWKRLPDSKTEGTP